MLTRIVGSGKIGKPVRRDRGLYWPFSIPLAPYRNLNILDSVSSYLWLVNVVLSIGSDCHNLTVNTRSWSFSLLGVLSRGRLCLSLGLGGLLAHSPTLAGAPPLTGLLVGLRK